MTLSEMIVNFIQGDHKCLGNIEACQKAGEGECTVCGRRDCPHHEACVFDEEGDDGSVISGRIFTSPCGLSSIQGRVSKDMSSRDSWFDGNGEEDL